ncbi:MAG: ABC transporter ATP-binding protein/permease [Candidatus Pacebacteria bacterium]|nr:ABC transporter ATP-binding protein/permease [Candidatus Paceibacterota bacterium]
MFKNEFFKKLWQLTKPYWRSSDRGWGYLLLSLTIILNLGTVALSVLLNQWSARFFNAIQDYNKEAFVKELWVFTGLAFIFVAVAIYKFVTQSQLIIRWRNWLTDHYLDRYLANQGYYRMQLSQSNNPSLDNPDQRIATDVGAFVAQTLSLAMNLLNALVTLVSFTVILWGLSGVVHLTLPSFMGGAVIPIYGYLLWIAIVYAGFGTWIVFKIGRPLIALTYRKEAVEAAMRFSLIRLREQGEGVAIYHGEPAESVTLKARLSAVIEIMIKVLRQTKIIIAVRSVYGQLANIFPYIVVAPRYFAKEISFGTMTQTAGAFGQVQDSLSILIDSYTSIAEWQAVINRLHDFNHGVLTIGLTIDQYHQQQKRSLAADGAKFDLDISDLQVFLPDGRMVHSLKSLQVKSGDSLLITGTSGSGKTTLLRVLAGVWPYWHGTIVMAGEPWERLFLPQRPYLPEGSLASALAYPRPIHLLTAEERAEFSKVLEITNLEFLTSRLDEIGQWSQSLSPGEQQRLAIARLLLLKPKLAFLDEATSALDEQTEAKIYQAIRQHLPKLTLVSVGHRQTLSQFHNQTLHIERSLD